MNHRLLRWKGQSQVVASFEEIDAGLEFELNAADTLLAGGRIDHASSFLQFLDRNESERRIVFAHLAFVEIDDGERLINGSWR